MRAPCSSTIASVLIFCTAAVAAAADQPPPPPFEADIKACIKQMDMAGKWQFEWQALEIGAPRHPRNDYEALSFSGGPGRRSDYGYPVHVVYTLVGPENPGARLANIDSVYWLIRDASGHWEIPAVCVMR